MVSKKGIHYLCEYGIEKCIPRISVFQYSASPVMLKVDHREGLFYPILTLMVDSYWSVDWVIVTVKEHTSKQIEVIGTDEQKS